ncbi:unnamed protein product [Lactuca virosa]|uniref:BED-type domain-containing protein n=1 Tax=Lactuca virosa TaxID=75947 RepID=A0AAU9NET5_9ASTR|nr:unnamed protein product [Lactuca virosa]
MKIGDETSAVPTTVSYTNISCPGRPFDVSRHCLQRIVKKASSSWRVGDQRLQLRHADLSIVIVSNSHRRPARFIQCFRLQLPPSFPAIDSFILILGQRVGDQRLLRRFLFPSCDRCRPLLHSTIFVIMSSAEPSQPNDSNMVNDTANSAVNCNEKQIKFTSPMWRHFTYEEVNGTKKAVCKYCRKEITYTTKNGTEGMHSHHKSCKIRIGQKKIDDFQSQLTGKKSKTNQSGGSVLATHRFNYDDLRTDLAKMITKHDYPLRIVEHEGFRDFCQGLQPPFRPICRNTARSDVIKLYGEEKARMMHFLESIQRRIAITTDI